MRFAKAQEKKMGKPETAQVVKPRGPQKSPISKGWISTWHARYKRIGDISLTLE
jgi:hypothetical protein